MLRLGVMTAGAIDAKLPNHSPRFFLFLIIVVFVLIVFGLLFFLVVLIVFRVAHGFQSAGFH